MTSLKLALAASVVALATSGCCLDPCGILGCLANSVPTAVPTAAALSSPAFGAAESVLREAPAPAALSSAQKY